MNGAPIITLSAAFLAVGVVAVWLRYRNAKEDLRAIAAYPGLNHINRATLLWRYVGIGLGLAVVTVVFVAGSPAPVMVAAPAILACVIEACLLIGELVDYSYARKPGAASLERRDASNYLPRRLMALVIAMTVAVVTLMAIGSALAAPSGRSYAALVCIEDAPSIICTICSEVSPFFGAHFVTPTAIGLTVAFGLAGAMAVLTARRPRNGADATLAAWDDALRRRSNRAALATLTGGVGGSLAIVALAMFGGQRVASDYNDLSNPWVAQCVDRTGDATGYYVPAGQHAFGHPLALVAIIICLVVGLLVALAAAIFLLTDFVPERPDGVWPETADVTGAMPEQRQGQRPPSPETTTTEVTA